MINMTKKATGIVAYITVIGWLIAWFAGDREGAKVHLNNGLILALASLISGVIGYFPIIGGFLYYLLETAILVFVIIGIVYAAQDQDKELPLIGQIRILQ